MSEFVQGMLAGGALVGGAVALAWWLQRLLAPPGSPSDTSDQGRRSPPSRRPEGR